MERIGVFCASSERMAPQYYESAEALGHWIGESGKTLVYGGANCGLMESVARSVKKAGGQVFGVVPRKLVSEGRVSDYIDITFHCNDLSDRKQWLIDESDLMILQHLRNARQESGVLEYRRFLRPSLFFPRHT